MKSCPLFALSALTALACAPSFAAQPIESEAPTPIPDVARAMIDAAYETEDPVQVSAVANAAMQVFPKEAEAIGAYADKKREALSSPLFAGRVKDELVVTAEPEKEKQPPSVDARPDEVELKPGKAPKFLGLGPWKGKATASGLRSTGNSQNAAAGFQFEAHRDFGDFTHNLAGRFDFGKSKGKTTQQRWGASYKLDYRYSDKTYAFARLSYDEDAFSGFDYRLFAGLGVGRRLFNTEGFKWKVEGGPGYQYAPIDDTREVDNHPAAYLSSETDWLIRDGLKFEQDVNGTWTSPTSTIVSQTTLTTVLTDTLSTGISYLYRYETDPPSGRLNEDTTFRLNLTYGF